MTRVKKLLPDKYFLDKNFIPLIDKISATIYHNEKNFDDSFHKLTFDEIKDVVFDALTLIKPKYNSKTKKYY